MLHPPINMVGTRAMKKVSREMAHWSVIRNGPYPYVRHPTYLATLGLWSVTGPMLDSWWAIIPGSLTALMMVVRTALEDRMLKAELPGYTSYAENVRYRLIPGLW